MSEVATVMLKSCIKERLDMVASAINVAVFGEGVLQAADAFLKVAEAATHSQRWLSEEKVVVMREAYDRLYAGEGSKDDLKTILSGAPLFNKIIDADRRLDLFKRHELEFHEVKQVEKDLKFYRKLLRPGWPLLDTAFDQLNDQQRRDVGLPIEQRVAPRLK
jgi:aminopeptidase N